MTIRCIIIDDEPLARRGLGEYIADLPFLQLLGGYDHPLQAVDMLQSGKVDLVFLDIQMPRISGIDFLKSVPQPVPVIFTTAYPQFAIEGFNLNALDYLLKPFSFERFMQAAMKARTYYALRSGEDAQDHFFIKSDGRLVKILHRDVLLVEAVQNYVNIHTTAKKYLTYLTFKSVEEFLPPEAFIRTHKSYIVSVARIDSIDGNDIRIGTHTVPISRGMKDEVMQKLLGNRYLKR